MVLRQIAEHLAHNHKRIGKQQRVNRSASPFGTAHCVVGVRLKHQQYMKHQITICNLHNLHNLAHTNTCKLAHMPNNNNNKLFMLLRDQLSVLVFSTVRYKPLTIRKKRGSRNPCMHTNTQTANNKQSMSVVVYLWSPIFDVCGMQQISWQYKGNCSLVSLRAAFFLAPQTVRWEWGERGGGRGRGWCTRSIL